MSDDGTTKDDVKIPDGEVGEKIEKLFRTEEKDTSKHENTQLVKSNTEVVPQMLLS